MSSALSVAEQRDALREENRRLILEKDELTAKTDELDTKLRALNKKLDLYEEQLDWFKNKLYGRGSEQLTAAERQQIRLFDEIEHAAAKHKAQTKRTETDQPVHSLRTLLNDLATIAKNQVVARIPDAQPFEVITRPTDLQSTVFSLLGVRL